MAKREVYLAVDLGAESGRVMAGLFDGERIELKELHRFANGPVYLPDGMYWDALRLFGEVKAGLAKAGRAYGKDVVSLGVDTWGVDFGLLDRRGELLGNPRHYRDGRTEGVPEKAFRKVPREALYRKTGIQFMPLNTVFQLHAMARERSPALAAARTLLFMPDLVNFWLTGVQANEWTIASTSQCLDPRRRAWAAGMLRKLGIPPSIFADLVDSGTVLGPLRPRVAEETGLRRARVVAPGCHDTASAVAAVPARDPAFAFLSSGTWSLMGVETAAPVINARTLACNLTNEGGVCGTIRLLKNIAGLWILQECRRTWAAGGEALTYGGMARMARGAPPFRALVDPEDPLFLAPGDMPARLRAYCRRTGQRAPSDKAGTVRMVLESLALAYRRVFGQVGEVTGGQPAVLHVMGGGSRNTLLNRMTADALGVPVEAGPVEATAAGNLLVQLLARRRIGSLAEGRRLVAASFETATYTPRGGEAWEGARERFERLARA